jgi:nitrite reductase/ring-hydroxylating ferredoxin subunit
MDLENGFVKVGLASEIPPRSMKHLDIDGKEIALINIDGQYYAIEERCGHMNAPMSKGQIRVNAEKKIISWPLHYATFDILTGQKLSEPVMTGMDMSSLPKNIQDYFTKAGEIISFVRTNNMQTYQVINDNDELKVKLST